MITLKVPLLPKKPITPYIRSKGPRAMTIVAGFKCVDGIVLCADSQITAPDVKYNAEKIVVYSSGIIDAVFAFAGTEVFSRMCIKRLSKVILSSEFSDVEEALRTESLAIHQDYSPQAKAYPAEYDLDLLVAVKFANGLDDQLALYHIEGPTISPAITNFDCIGIGRSLAREAISLFYKDKLSVQEASRIGVYCLKQTKDHVDGCGGPSQVTLIWDGVGDEIFGATRPTNLEPSTILEIEAGFVALFEALRPVFLSFNDANPYDSSFAKHLGAAARSIKKMWNKTFKKIVKREKKNLAEIKEFMTEFEPPKDF